MNHTTFSQAPTLGYQEAAERLGLAEITLRKYVSAGRIDHFKFGSRVRFSEDHIAEFMRRSEVKAREAENV